MQRVTNRLAHSENHVKDKVPVVMPNSDQAFRIVFVQLVHVVRALKDRALTLHIVKIGRVFHYAKKLDSRPILLGFLFLKDIHEVLSSLKRLLRAITNPGSDHFLELLLYFGLFLNNFLEKCLSLLLNFGQIFKNFLFISIFIQLFIFKFVNDLVNELRVTQRWPVELLHTLGG